MIHAPKPLPAAEFARIIRECRSYSCTRMMAPGQGATEGQCVGGHCPYCGAPVGHYGHEADKCSARSEEDPT